MYLKRIEMKGFKSFADRTVIEFNNAITCVVGPNGSGKSNVADAFRWVLGEQSYKNLRSSNMGDVIFNGTNTRAPLAVAEVSVVFDNSDGLFDIDFLEVSITRRLFKSGESEYYINKTPCRLKDIKHLIMDTGIGVEGYSIIAQGRIEQLLSANKAERRLIFEEAAGIVKHKSSKEESVKKLEKSQINIDRVNDIIKELETRIEPLREQSENASLYKTLIEELKSLEINVFIQDIGSLDAEISAINSEISKLALQKSEIEERLKEFVSANEDLSATQRDLEAQQENVNSNLIQYQNKLSEIKHLIELNNQKIQLIDRNILELKEDIEISLREKDDVDAKVNEQFAATEQKLKGLKDAAALMTKHMEESEQLDKNMQADIQCCETEISELQNKIFAVERSLNADKSSLNILSIQEKNNEGFDKSVKEVLKLAENDGEVYGALRDLIELDEKFNKAVEIALGRAIQNVLVKNKEVASKYINLLKMKRLGRVTFLPVENLSERKRIDIKSKSGFYGCAVDILKYDEKYESAISYLLGNVYLVDSIEIANKMYHEFPKSARVVSLDGDLLIIGGAITGGSTIENRASGFLGRAKKIERLEVLVQTQTTNLNKLIHSRQVQIQKLNELKYDYNTTKNARMELSSRYKLNEEMIVATHLELSSFEDVKVREIAKLNQTIEQKNTRINQYLAEIAILNQENANADQNLEKNKKVINLSLEKIEALKQEQNEIKSKIDEYRAEFERYNMQLTDLKDQSMKFEVDRTRFETKRENLLQNLWDSYELGYLEALDYKGEFDYNFSTNKIKGIKSQLKKIGDVNVSAIEEYRVQKERYDFLTTQRNDLNDSIGKLKKLISDIDLQMKQSFSESFEQIKASFQSTFSSLFGGGNVDLELQGSDDVLEADIIINAQPPGKKLQNLDLMSGGEKALTAIALLFAILSTKPSPFCILDEIEAALDDVNIFRFSEFLKTYSKNSQFIIITHRRGTMEIADAIYGVTMEEKGISKVLYRVMNEMQDI